MQSRRRLTSKDKRELLQQNLDSKFLGKIVSESEVSDSGYEGSKVDEVSCALDFDENINDGDNDPLSGMEEQSTSD